MPWQALTNLTFPIEAGEGGGGGELLKDAQEPDQPREYCVFFPAAFMGRGDRGTQQKTPSGQTTWLPCCGGVGSAPSFRAELLVSLRVEVGQKMHSAQTQEGPGLNTGEMTRPWGRAVSDPLATSSCSFRPLTPTNSPTAKMARDSCLGFRNPQPA